MLFNFIKKNMFPFIISLVFLMVTIYVYKKYLKNSITPSYVANKEFIKKTGSSSTNSCDLYLFYTEWCPHCKNAKPEWEQLEIEYAHKPINGYQINFIKVDCEQDTELADKYNIKSYPTVKLVSGNQVITFDAHVDKQSLEQFLNTVLQ